MIRQTADLLEDARAYLQCLAEGDEPGPRLRCVWNRFFRRHTRGIHRAARARGLSAADAEDCAQEVWLEILRELRRDAYDPGRGRFGCWLATLIRNRVVSFVRRTARRPEQAARSLDGALTGREPDPAASFEREQRRHLVRHVLSHLRQQVSTTNYRLIHLRWIEGRGVPEVALELKLTRQQVWYRHRRVKRRLRRLLESHGQRATETGT